MEGTITVDKDQVIFTSIPYDKDWEITIDGKKVQQTKILGEFMGIVSMIIHEIIKRKKQKDTKLA